MEGLGKHAWKKMFENLAGVSISEPLSALRRARGAHSWITQLDGASAISKSLAAGGKPSFL